MPDREPSQPASLAGLSEQEAAARRARGQGNDVRIPTSRSYARIVRENAFTVVNVVLFAVSVLLIPFGLAADAIVTAGPVLMNVIVGIVQEVRAKRKLDRIALLARPTATVVRDGEERVVDPSRIVLGDLIVVRRGDQVVVDGHIVDGQVEVDESQLTGESDLIRRLPGDRLLSGSFCGAGTGVYEVEQVGRASFTNQLLAQARRFRDARTPLQRDVGRAIFVVSILVLLGSLPIGWILGRPGPNHDPTDLLQAAAVLVALVPQGLAVMITVTYALGAIRISRRGALVQRLSAVEAMSRVDTLCVDKTGTLTTQRIALRATAPLGVGEQELGAILGAMAASTQAGNRTTEAIAAAWPGEAQPVLDEVPFLSDRRWSALRIGGARAGTYVLGAPAVLGPAIAAVGAGSVRLSPGIAAAGLAGTPADPGLPPGPPPDPDFDERIREWTADGLRVLLVARAPAGAALHDADGHPVQPAPLVPLGLLAFAEEMRPGVRSTLEAFAAGGVDVRVISGDDPETVGALARQAGMGSVRPASGLELAPLDDEALATSVESAKVMGRVNPPLKARIVLALRRRGRFVAMIGDGVNDILALRQAHLGIAMGSGSQATRAVADIVLVDDDFGVLPAAVIEGQRIVAAMQATLYLLLSRTLYMLILVVGAVVAGLAFPVSPRNNAVLALVTVGIPTIAVAFWVQPCRPPRSLLGATWRFAIPAGIAAAAVCLPVEAYYTWQGAPEGVVSTAVTTMTVFCGIGLLTLLPGALAPREGEPTAPGLGDWRPWALAATMVALYGALAAVPLTRHFFELTLLPLSDVLLLGLLAAAWTAALHLSRRVGMVDRLVRPPAGGSG